MIADHPVFVGPKNPEAKLWRYLDFTKFVDLLATEELYFSRSDLLGDPFEGSTAEFNISMRPQIYAGSGIPPQAFEDHGQLLKRMREYIAINCWHTNECESAAMWKLYLQSSEGVAIQTTYRRLVKSLETTEDQVYVGVVNYIDYETQWMPEGNLFYPFIHKRRSFEHEREVRAIIVHDWPIKKGDRCPKEPIDGGIRVKVDLGLLVERVVVSPTSPAWFSKLVTQVCRQFGADFQVVSSPLSKRPVY